MRNLVAILIVAACGSKPPPPAPPPAAPAAPAPVAAAPTPSEADKPAPPAVDPETTKADAVAAETAAYDKAKPVFDKFCKSCHVKGAKNATAKKLGHFDMTTYPFGGEHAKSIGNEIRVVLAIDGSKKASMPDGKPGSVKGDDLAAIKAWSEAWQAAGAAGAHPADPADKDDD